MPTSSRTWSCVHSIVHRLDMGPALDCEIGIGTQAVAQLQPESCTSLKRLRMIKCSSGGVAAKAASKVTSILPNTKRLCDTIFRSYNNDVKSKVISAEVDRCYRTVRTVVVVVCCASRRDQHCTRARAGWRREAVESTQPSCQI